MLRLSFLFLAALCYCESVYITSSFWAPLFNPRILNYRVDVPFNPDAGKNAREEYAKKYGDKGERLIADLGNGKGPKRENENYEQLIVYSTFPGAGNNK